MSANREAGTFCPSFASDDLWLAARRGEATQDRRLERIGPRQRSRRHPLPDPTAPERYHDAASRCTSVSVMALGFASARERRQLALARVTTFSRWMTSLVVSSSVHAITQAWRKVLS